MPVAKGQYLMLRPVARQLGVPPTCEEIAREWERRKLSLDEFCELTEISDQTARKLLRAGGKKLKLIPVDL